MTSLVYLLDLGIVENAVMLYLARDITPLGHHCGLTTFTLLPVLSFLVHGTVTHHVPRSKKVMVYWM
jgi:hypothetical protein